MKPPLKAIIKLVLIFSIEYSLINNFKHPL